MKQFENVHNFNYCKSCNSGFRNYANANATFLHPYPETTRELLIILGCGVVSKWDLKHDSSNKFSPMYPNNKFLFRLPLLSTFLQKPYIFENEQDFF